MIFFIFFLGLMVGSFLNVVICRLETKEPIMFGRSHCPKCGAVLKWHNLIPIFSFVFQKGRCCYCGEKISWQYPLIEITTGLLFLLIFNFGFRISSQFLIYEFLNFFYFLFIVSVLIIIFVYDLKHYIIPDKIVYPAIIAALLCRLSVWGFNHRDFIRNWKLETGDFKELINPLLAALVAGGFFLFLVLVSKGLWMGLGDVKLAVLMGLVLGWPNVLLALFLSFVGGAIVGLGLIVLKKKSMKSQIPFGPFLAGSAILVMILGNHLTKIISWFIL